MRVVVQKLKVGGGRASREEPYEVEITDTQYRKLFGDDPAKVPATIDCGSFACAFPYREDDKVTKITRDESDVAALIKAQGLTRVPKLHAVYKLKSKTEWVNRAYQAPRPTAYAMVVEKLVPVTSPRVDDATKCLGRSLFEFVAANRRAGQRGLSKPQLRYLWRCCPSDPFAIFKTYSEVQKARRVLPGAEKSPEQRWRPLCRRFVGDLARAATELLERGIPWHDIHSGNIGLGRDGRWKVLDLGAHEMKLAKSPPVLRGRWAGSRRAP